MIQHELKFTEGTKMKILIKKCNNSTTNTISTKWKNKKKKKKSTHNIYYCPEFLHVL